MFQDPQSMPETADKGGLVYGCQNGDTFSYLMGVHLCSSWAHLDKGLLTKEGRVPDRM